MMIAGILATSFVGYFYNLKANVSLETMYTQNLYAIERLSDARTQSRANFANVLDLMVTQDEASKSEILKDFVKRADKINSDFTDFEKLEINKYETEQISLIRDNLSKWDTISKKMMDLVSAGNVSEANTLFKSEGEAIFENLQTSIRDLETYNMNEAEKLYDSNKQDGRQAVIRIILISAVMTILSIALGIIITRTITRSVYKIVSLIKKTSNLDLVYDSSYDAILEHKDEIGIIAKEVENLRNVLRDMVRNVINISSNLAASSEELAASTEENSKTIKQVVYAVNEIAQGNSSQAEMVESTGQTIHAMVTGIDEVNRATAVNSENAKGSIEAIGEGQKAIDLTMVKMNDNKKMAADVGASIQELSSRMDKVGNIVNVIKEISEQTNLLALNASIEAARAGEAGKGFAVVASEIGKLANNTASSVDEITGIISDAISRNSITAQNNEAAMAIVLEQEKAVNVTKEAFTKIRQSVEEIVNRTLMIAKKMSDIDASAKDISKQTLDMSAVAQEAAASSEEISASNEEQLASIEMIAASANDLAKMASELNEEMVKFQI
jgi:Methyl-accepting chemotaxis protein